MCVRFRYLGSSGAPCTYTHTYIPLIKPFVADLVSGSCFSSVDRWFGVVSVACLGITPRVGEGRVLNSERDGWMRVKSCCNDVLGNVILLVGNDHTVKYLMMLLWLLELWLIY